MMTECIANLNPSFTTTFKNSFDHAKVPARPIGFLRVTLEAS